MKPLKAGMDVMERARRASTEAERLVVSLPPDMRPRQAHLYGHIAASQRFDDGLGPPWAGEWDNHFDKATDSLGFEDLE